MRMLFLVFIVIPILEMWVLIEVGSIIGSLPTIALVFATAFLGALLLRREGVKTLLHARGQLEAGQLPIEDILSGILLAVGGALLLTPGFITDTVGFLCLIPMSRHWLVRGLKQYWLQKGAHSASFTSGNPAGKRTPPKQTTTIEGEFEREE